MLTDLGVTDQGELRHIGLLLADFLQDELERDPTVLTRGLDAIREFQPRLEEATLDVQSRNLEGLSGELKGNYFGSYQRLVRLEQSLRDGQPFNPYEAAMALGVLIQTEIGIMAVARQDEKE